MPDMKTPSRGLVRIRVPTKLFGRANRSKSREPTPREPEPLVGEHMAAVRLPSKPEPLVPGARGRK